MPQKTRRRQGGVRARSTRTVPSLATLGRTLKRSSLSRFSHRLKTSHINRTVKTKPLRSVYMGSMKRMKKAEHKAARAAHKAHLAQQAAMHEVARMSRIARGDNSNSNDDRHKSVKSHKRNVGLNYITRLMSTGKSFIGLVNKQNKSKATRKRVNKIEE